MYKNIAIKINKEDCLSRDLQERLFFFGNKWQYGIGAVVQNVFCDYIFIGPDGLMSQGTEVDYLRHKYPIFHVETRTQIVIVESPIRREKISLGGKEYYKDELEVALKNIKPI
jgi:hypothetical protein